MSITGMAITRRKMRESKEKKPFGRLGTVVVGGEKNII